MGVLRSEEMCHMKIRIPSDNANRILSALGSMEDAIEFIDLTKNDVEAKKVYGLMVKRCDEAVNKITDLEMITKDFNVPMVKYSNYSDFQSDLKEDMKNRDKKFGSTYFDLAEAEVIETDRQVKELANSLNQIREDLFRLIEKKYVFNKAADMLSHDLEFKSSFAETDAGINNIKQSSTNVNLITGVIKASEELKMKRMIFRISHGRALTTFYDLDINKEEFLFTSSIRQRGFSLVDQKEFKSSEDLAMIPAVINDPYTRDKKKIFNVIFPGSEENILQGKILKVCDIFQASRYGVPKNDAIKTELALIEKDIFEKKRVLLDSERNIMEILKKSSMKKKDQKNSYILSKLYFKQEKMVYMTLTKCRIHETFIDGEVWIPKSKLPQVEAVLKRISDEGKEDLLTANLKPIEPYEVNSDLMPPTFIQTNDFMWAFQEIVNTYGIPRYQEINPAYFTVITFPFLFGIMYGDIGHGAILLVCGAYLCICSSSLQRNAGTITKVILKAKYLLLLMGLFATFCGILYSEFFSIPLELSSCYFQNELDIVNRKEGCVYSIGLDPRWLISSNELTFINSFKMKFSVIIGVIHMLFGIILKGINSAYNNEGMIFFFGFIPQFILMLSLFGFMNLLIIIKWLTNWAGRTDQAPDIKSILMNIFLKLGVVTQDFWANPSTQTLVHRIILAIFFICALVMLLPKTFLEYFHALKEYNMKRNDLLMGPVKQPLLIEEVDGQGDDNNKHAGKPSLSDFFVNEIIETIEFILGTISNTASYLRLWALSLAHSQLSKVFLEQTILGKQLPESLKDNIAVQIIFIYAIYVLWGYLTIGVLLFMDLMECCLHTLRLHWVEFQGKFYKADGYLFKPFSFSQSFVSEEEQ